MKIITIEDIAKERLRWAKHLLKEIHLLKESECETYTELSNLHGDNEKLEAEVQRLREQVKDLEYEVEHWQGELQSRMHPIDYDALVNGGEEE